MSGTSHDGLDIAYCQFTEVEGKWSFKILKAETIPYSQEWKNRLLALPEAEENAIREADLALGDYIGKTVKTFIDANGINTDFVASHGHTIFHQPSRGITLQIGNGNSIAAHCGTKVINNFRTEDVALGGQGAPLVPLGDQLLFAQYDYCINIGGIANISYESEGKRIAFDICPANMVLNYLAGKRGKDYDDGGKMASKGKVIEKALVQMESLPYYSLTGPRSLGREWVIENILPLMEAYADWPIEDQLATFTEHIALRISSILNNTTETILVSGGGVYNSYLIERIKSLCKAEIIVPAPSIIDYKEAMIFAFLGLLRLKGINNVLGSVTGSGMDHCAGKVFNPHDYEL